MPLYLIRRDMCGWDQDDLYACMLRAKLCLPRFEGLRCLLSYYDAQSGMAVCHAEAPDEAVLWDHARSSGLPITAVHRVELLNPAALDVEADQSAVPWQVIPAGAR